MAAPEDEVDEPPTAIDGRHLRSRGYSPRRSVSGSGRVEMYFPEVDVDVRQHQGAREPSSPFSHIRSSEDISSGYSSAEPLYTGHHPTKAEGLAGCREPLVRTASVGGSTRSVRSKSTRGGTVAKRGGIAEDSDWCVSHDSTDEEECYYDIPSDSPSSALPIPTPVPSSNSLQTFLSENILSLNNLVCTISSSMENVVHIVPATKSNARSNEMLLSDECMVENSIELEVSSVNAEAKSSSLVTETVTGSNIFDVQSIISEVSSCKCETQAIAENLLTNNDTSTSETSELPTDSMLQQSEVEKIETFSVHGSEQGKLDSEKSETAENKTIALDHAISDATNGISLRKDTEQGNVSTNTEYCENELQIDNINECELNAGKVFSQLCKISSSNIIEPKRAESVKGDKEQVDESKDLQTKVPSVCDWEDKTVLEVKTLVQPEGEAAADITCVSTVEVKLVTNYKEEDNAFSFPHTGEQEQKERTQAEQTAEPVLEVRQMPAKDSSVTDHKQSVVEEPCTSAELQDELREPSGSQVSLQKDGRAGRYYKRPAPVPPCADNMSDDTPAQLQLQNMLPASDEKKIIAGQTSVTDEVFFENKISNQEVPTVNKIDEQMESSGQHKLKGATPSPRPIRKQSDEDAAIKARLVLKPGIVKNVGPALEGENRSEVFIAKSKPKRKSSKRKYMESAVSRIFVMPHFTSLLPFWRDASSSQKPSNSAESSRRNSSVSSSSVGDDSFVRCAEVRKSPSPALLEPDCGRSRRGASVTFADGDSDHGETSSGLEVKGILKKTGISGSIKVRDLSHSPIRSRQPAPLADWED